MTQRRCPRCGNTQVSFEKVSLAEGRVVNEFHCAKCRLFEDAVSDSPGFDTLWKRWEAPQDA